MIARDLISVVDDDESVRDSIDALLRSVGYRVALFSSGEEFLESGAISDTKCLVLDVQMARMNGLELQCRLSSRVPIVFATAHGEERHRRHAFEHGASDFLQKPVLAVEFLAAIERACRSREDRFRFQTLAAAAASGELI